MPHEWIQPGVEVIVSRSEWFFGGQKRRRVFTRAKVFKRYPNFAVVEFPSGVREAFHYDEITKEVPSNRRVYTGYTQSD